MNFNDIMKIVEAMNRTSVPCMKRQVIVSDEYNNGFIAGQAEGIRWTLEKLKTLINEWLILVGISASFEEFYDTINTVIGTKQIQNKGESKWVMNYL